MAFKRDARPSFLGFPPLKPEDDSCLQCSLDATWCVFNPSSLPHFSLPTGLEWTQFKVLLRVGWIGWVLLVVEFFSQELNAEWVRHLLVDLEDVRLVVHGLLVWVKVHLDQLLGVVHHVLVELVCSLLVEVGLVHVGRLVHQFVGLLILLVCEGVWGLKDSTHLQEFLNN